MFAGTTAANAQLAERLIPNLNRAANSPARQLQNALNNAGCYPLHVSIVAKTDGNFGTRGSRSRQAISNYLSARNVAASTFLTTQQFIRDVQTSGTRCLQVANGICRKDSIGPQYLASLEGVDDVRKLSIALRTAVDKFDSTLFPQGKGDPLVLSDSGERSNKGRIKSYGIKGVTTETTRTALAEAVYNFDNLVLSYALQTPECQMCAAVNDWLYLRNIASANAGYLIAKKHNADIFYRFKVENIPEDLMEQVRPNIRVYRSITAKLNTMLSQNADPAATRNHIIQRDAEMASITKHFQNNYVSGGSAKPMAKVASGQCTGFDGSSIYQ